MTDEHVLPTTPEAADPTATPAEVRDEAAEPGIVAAEAQSAPAEPTAAPANAEAAPDAPADDEGLDGPSFGDLLSAFEREHTHRAATKQLEGTVVSLTAEQVFLDIGYKTEGVLPRAAFEHDSTPVQVGDAVPVSIVGRNEEGYYELSRFRVEQPRDWSAIERAFEEKAAVAGMVTEQVKGGLRVDIGVRAFMPASRSGARDAEELAALVGQAITCRITKLDIADEDVVVDRRVVLEEQTRAALAERRAALQEGATVTGKVRTLMPYGAFVEIEPGLDGLLHISDIARTRINKPDDVLSVGEELTLRVLKIDAETNKISLGLKQLQPEPWETAAERYLPGQRIAGTVTRLANFGAFVELEPGLEGLIHISEMSWAKKVRHPGDLLHQGDRVDAVVLAVKPPTASEPGRISLGLKQTLADPWLDAPSKFPIGAQIEGPVTKLMNFGAFVELAPGVEGLVHIGEIVADRRLNHPREALREGQRVQAIVLAIDSEKRQIRLSMKQALPTSIDEYIAEHKAGDRVSGRVVECTAAGAIVELGEGIRANCRASHAEAAATATAAFEPAAGKPDLSQLSTLLKARWKGNAPAASAQPEALAAGQVRTFRIVKLAADTKKIDVEPA